MLGVLGVQRGRLHSFRDVVARMHGHTGKLFQISQYRMRAEIGWIANGYGVQRPKDLKKNTINYHLSRMYPQIVGPRKRK